MELTLKQLEENPELEATFEEDLEKAVKIPYVLKNKVLMSPGIWNNYYYKENSLRTAFDNTDWDAKEINSLFLDHQDDRSSEWVGWVRNPKLKGENIIGDLVVVDKATAIKLYAGAKFGISPKVKGQEHKGEMVDFVFDNFSIVLNPAVKTAYINNMEVNKMAEEDNKKEEVKKEDEEQKEEVKKEPQKEAEVKSEDSEKSEEAEQPAEKSEETSENKDVYNESVGNIADSLGISVDKLKETLESLAKKKDDEDEEDEEDKKKKYPEPEEMSDDELLDIVSNSAWTDFVAKMRKKYPDMSIKDIAKEFKKQKSEKLSQELSENADTVKELKEKLNQIEKKLQEPARLSMKCSTSKELSQSDPDAGFLQLLKNGR